MISRIPSNGVRLLFWFKSPCQYCTTAGAAAAAEAAQSQQPHFLEGLLINSLGFSKQEALSTTNKVNRYKSSRKDFNLVINFFQDLGLNKSQIKSIVSADPRLLFADVNKTLKPNLSLLQDLGLSGSVLIEVILKYNSLLRRGLDSGLRPCVEYLRNLLGTDEKVVKAVKTHPALLRDDAPRRIERKVLLLRKAGFSDENVSKYVVSYPRAILNHKPEWIQKVLHMVTNDFGILRESKMFYYGFSFLSGVSKSTMDVKFGILRSFGWSDAAIYRMGRNYPGILGLSEDKMRKSLNFFMKELGYAPEYMASHAKLLSMNLERRMKPRIEVLKILNDKNLNKRKRKASLYVVLCMSESKFMKNYLLPYKNEIRDMYESYIKTVGRSTTEKC